MNDNALKRAEAAFKKEKRATEASRAWREYEANQAAVNANMARLRALRLAREAVGSSITESPKNKVV